jgi:hypothetical protein
VITVTLLISYIKMANHANLLQFVSPEDNQFELSNSFYNLYIQGELLLFRFDGSFENYIAAHANLPVACSHLFIVLVVCCVQH